MAGVYAIVALLGAPTLAQVSKTAEIAPVELVRAVVANEIAAANNAAIKFMFRSRKQMPTGLQDRIYVQANEALASMTIGENNHPLTPEQERAETARLMALANNPNQLRRKQAREKQEIEHTLCIVKALPDAFRYEYAGTEASENSAAKPGDPLVRLKFTPNPSYVPPSRVEEVLQGMDGYVLINTRARRLARIDGTLFRDVTFGWGIFGRLDKGGHFLVQQADVGGGFWEITDMSLKIRGKILLIKTLNLISDEVFSDFQRLPADMPFAKSVELLQTTQEKLAQDLRASLPTQRRTVRQ